MPKSTSDAVEPIALNPPNFQTVTIPIEGTSELIVHRFSEKARREMLERQQSKTRKIKEPKDPEKDYQESMYRLPDGRLGFPAAGFKIATVDACRYFDGLPMTLARTIMRMVGEGPEQLVPIEGEPYMREDPVRLESGVADLRYRAGIWPWSTTLSVRWNADILTLNSLCNLIDAGGEGGIGEWRPNSKKGKGGTYGTFRIKREEMGI